MKTEQEIKMLKIVWAFMLENGTVTSGNWSYYGGRYSPTKDNHNGSLRLEVQEAVQKFNVDWSKTSIPNYETNSSFVGTDEMPDEHECFVGTLFLNNGSSYLIGTSEISELAEHAYFYLKYGSASEPEDLVKKYFGE